MSDNIVVPVSKPYVCHGQNCKSGLTLAEAWVPAAAAIRRALGRMPSQVRDLADHIHCGRCAHLGRKAGVQFHRLPQTVAWMEQRRVERMQNARRAFQRYLPQEPLKSVGAKPATPTARQ